MMKLDYVCGLSPQYWSYIPMTVLDVLNLNLRDGINYYSTTKTKTKTKTSPSSEKASSSELDQLCPVSRCVLVGQIVYASERRRDGSIQYILDDGTGCVDCVQWWEYDNNTTMDTTIRSTRTNLFHLPSLGSKYDEEYHDDDDDNNNNIIMSMLLNTEKNKNQQHFVIGNLVRIYGKIECLASVVASISNNGNHEKDTTRRNTKNNNNSSTNDDKNDDEETILREIHISTMERVHNEEGEAEHWIQVAQKLGGTGTRRNSSLETTTRRCRSSSSSNSSIGTILDKLGPEIRTQIYHKVNLPAADDITQCSWRVFGTNCLCRSSNSSSSTSTSKTDNNNNNNADNESSSSPNTNTKTEATTRTLPVLLPYDREELLYCHCQAKVEPLDPFFVFRDAVLTQLQLLQARYPKRLQFQYKQLRYHNEPLQIIAAQVIAAATTTTTTTTVQHNNSIDGEGDNDDDNTNTDTDNGTTDSHHVDKKRRTRMIQNMKKNVVMVDRLFIKTFSALRHDGVIYLLNENTDEYLFLTRSKVLEPFVRSVLLQQKKNNNTNNNNKHYINYQNSPPYIVRNIHHERLMYIQRLLIQSS